MNCRAARYLCAGVIACAAPRGTADDWPEHGHDKAGTRYSTLEQITPANVTRLAVAWTCHSSEIGRGGGARR